jgi:prolyl-tRNA synthetase
MRLSTLFGHTLREAPADAETASHRLLMRAAMIRPLGAGLYTCLPLGWRVIGKIASIIRQEMEAIGAQEMLMPVVQPAELWQQSGQWASLARFKDRAGRELILAMASEEVLADLLRREISSYRQLPLAVYHIQTRFRDDSHPRGGLIHAREFLAKEAYSCHADSADMDAFYLKMYQAYVNIFHHCELEVLPVEAGAEPHQFMILAAGGEETLILCSACDYAANVEHATLNKGQPSTEPLLPIAEVATPDCTTIEAVASYVGVPTTQTLKAVFFVTTPGELIFAVLRGDLAVNEAKLANALGGVELWPAPWQVLEEMGITAGYASPIGVKKGVKVVVDDSARLGANFVAGANREGYHLKNVNYPRDFPADLETDIALARAGDPCPRCGAPLRSQPGIEVGRLSRPGTRYSAAFEATYLDQQGHPQPIVMGSYGIGLGRLLAAIVEQHHDEQGIIWPAAVAPYQVHLLTLGAEEEVRSRAEAIYADLKSHGLEVLYDDREESAGVKFADADLIGCPLRLTVSRRSLKSGGVEAKTRRAREAEVIPTEELIAWIADQ